MNNYGLEWMKHWLDPEEDRAASEVWKKRAKCFATPGLEDMFFPPMEPDPSDKSPEARARRNEAKQMTKAAKRFCKGTDDGFPCKAINDCFAYAMKEKLWVGVYGGTSGRERRKLNALANREAGSTGTPRPSNGTPVSLASSNGRSSRRTKPATKTETQPTSTRARSAKQTGAPEARGTASSAPQRTVKRRPSRGGQPTSTAKVTTSTTSTNGRSGRRASSSATSGAPSASTSGGTSRRNGVKPVVPPSSSTPKSRSKTTASSSSATRTGSSRTTRAGRSSK